MARKWTKEQLVLVITKWAVQAIRLQPFRSQKDLFVSVCVSDRDPKKMKHTCFLEDPETGNVAAFALDSPSPNRPTLLTGDSPMSLKELGRDFDQLAPDTLDEAFLREIDELAEKTDLAAIPTNFYTPRVPVIKPNEANEGAIFCLVSAVWPAKPQNCDVV